MSANLDLVRSIGEAFERGDFFSPAEWLDPASEFVIADGVAQPRTSSTCSGAGRPREAQAKSVTV